MYAASTVSLYHSISPVHMIHFLNVFLRWYMLKESDPATQSESETGASIKVAKHTGYYNGEAEAYN